MAPKYDFYQTEAKVVVDILLKNAKDKNYSLEITDQAIHLTADDGIDLVITLYQPIDKERSTHKVMTSKIEVILFKFVGQMWPQLEKAVEKVVEVPKEKKNWDKLAKEAEALEKEERQGEQALQALFEQIYSGASEEAKRAMNKSYMESGGTVLSTNWDEVGSKKVDVKPPDGCEYKRFES